MTAAGLHRSPGLFKSCAKLRFPLSNSFPSRTPLNVPALWEPWRALALGFLVVSWEVLLRTPQEVQKENYSSIHILNSGFVCLSKSVYWGRQLLQVRWTLSPFRALYNFQNLPSVVRGTAFQLHILWRLFKNIKRSHCNMGQGWSCATSLGKARVHIDYKSPLPLISNILTLIFFLNSVCTLSSSKRNGRLTNLCTNKHRLNPGYFWQALGSHMFMAE